MKDVLHPASLRISLGNVYCGMRRWIKGAWGSELNGKGSVWPALNSRAVQPSK